MRDTVGVGPFGDGVVDDDLDRTEAMLSRLGRREPVLADLDEPVIAALAMLAADVDLRPVPVSVTRQALAAGGVRLAPIVSPRSAPDRPASAEHAAAVAPATRAVRARAAAASGSARRARRTGAGRLRVVRLRSPLGLVAAAALVVVGGGMSALAADTDLASPLTRLTSAVGEWTSGSGEATHRRLEDRLKAARVALDQGRPAEAARLVHDVRREFGTLSTGQQVQQADVAHAIAELEGQLETRTPTGTASPAPGDPTDPLAATNDVRTGPGGETLVSAESGTLPSTRTGRDRGAGRTTAPGATTGSPSVVPTSSGGSTGSPHSETPMVIGDGTPSSPPSPSSPSSPSAPTSPSSPTGSGPRADDPDATGPAKTGDPLIGSTPSPTTRPTSGSPAPTASVDVPPVVSPGKGTRPPGTPTGSLVLPTYPPAVAPSTSLPPAVPLSAVPSSAVPSSAVPSSAVSSSAVPVVPAGWGPGGLFGPLFVPAFGLPPAVGVAGSAPAVSVVVIAAG